MSFFLLASSVQESTVPGYSFPPAVFTAVQSRLDFRKLQRALFNLMDPPSTPEQMARELSSAYENLAKSATPTPVVTGKRQIMEKILLAGLRSPNINPTNAAQTLVNSITAFWTGVLVPGGTVIAFLGQQVIMAELLANSQSTADPTEGSKRLARCLVDSTKLVQYVIPPNPPQFLV